MPEYYKGFGGSTIVISKKGKARTINRKVKPKSKAKALKVAKSINKSKDMVQCPFIGPPERLRTKFVWTLEQTVPVATGVIYTPMFPTTQGIILNSPVDPSNLLPSTPKHPAWWDYLRKMYRAYIVKGAYIDFEVRMTEDAGLMYVECIPTDTESVNIASSQSYAEYKGGKSGILTEQNVFRFRKYIDIRRLLGLAKERNVNQNSSLAGNTGSVIGIPQASPSITGHFLARVRNPTGAEANVYYRIKVTYLTELYDKILETGQES